MNKAKKLWLDECRESLVQAVGAAACAGEHETAARINAILIDIDIACEQRGSTQKRSSRLHDDPTKI